MLWSIPVASIQALATADQIGELSIVSHHTICFLFCRITNPFSYVSAHVPGLAWIATLNGGEIAAFVSTVYCILCSHLCNSPQSHQVLYQVNGYLPVVLLLVIILILPHIFYGIALHYEDRKTESDVQSSIIGRYFYYQVILALLLRPWRLYNSDLTNNLCTLLSLPTSLLLSLLDQFLIQSEKSLSIQVTCYQFWVNHFQMLLATSLLSS